MESVEVMFKMPHAERAKTAVPATRVRRVEVNFMNSVFQAVRVVKVTTEELPLSPKRWLLWKEEPFVVPEVTEIEYEQLFLPQRMCFSAWYEERTSGPLST